MIPFLAGYLSLRSPDGECVEVFNACRTVANFYKDGRAAGWTAEAEPAVWDGYCNWAWDDGEYSDEENPDPWHDPFDPATSETAGFLVDPPDSDGHGFYLEPSGSKRIVEANRFEPLEMFFTGSIISCTSRGEAAMLKWMDTTLRNCSAGCGGWEATVFAHYPCETDFEGAVFEGGDQVFVGDAGEPARPDSRCEDADSLQPGGVMAPYLDTGQRTLRKVVYRGFEQLDEGLDECYGNRYKFCFDVFDHCAVKPGLKVVDDTPVWDQCECFCTNRHEICTYQPVEYCAESSQTTPSVSAPIVSSYARPSADTRGGLIALPGRYVRPEKVNVKSYLTPVIGKGDWLPSLNIVNNSGDTFNIRASFFQAVDFVPPPDTEDGWCYYRGLDPCWRADIAVLRESQSLCFNTDCSVDLTCADGTVTDGQSLVDVSGKYVNCPGRYWVTIEVCCDSDVDFSFEAYLHQVVDI